MEIGIVPSEHAAYMTYLPQALSTPHPSSRSAADSVSCELWMLPDVKAPYVVSCWRVELIRLAWEHAGASLLRVDSVGHWQARGVSDRWDPNVCT